MFLRNDIGLDQAGGTATLSFGRALVPVVERTRWQVLRDRANQIDWAPDLGARIGSLEWWRGAATCASLIALTCALSPGFHQTLPGEAPAPLAGTQYDQARAQRIAPLGLGAGTGSRMASTALVVPLKDVPERPVIELSATFGDGDAFTSVLQRNGVGHDEAGKVADMVAEAVALDAIKPGTRLDLTLGRRPSKAEARPLEKLSFRARFDLALSVARAGANLMLARQPIAIDHTPLRLQGVVGGSLYRSLRAAGAPARAAETFIKAIGSRMAMGRIDRDATFDLALQQDKAATGEVQLGELQYAGIEEGSHKVQLVRWDEGDKTSWYTTDGVGERHGEMQMPAQGRLSSGFGLRYHPILHYVRMHKGVDIAVPWGSPVHAAMDGAVSGAGRSSGYGNMVKLSHGGGIDTLYGHLSRILVRSGQHVGRGQLIGYSGTSGLSTGPHLHFETHRNGVPVNPLRMSFSQIEQLSGSALAAFRARVASLLSVHAGAAGK